MNERIKELAAKAGWGPTSDPYNRQAFDVNMFAELIVNECARLVEESKWNLPRGCTAVDQAKYVKENFGIKDE